MIGCVRTLFVPYGSYSSRLTVCARNGCIETHSVGTQQCMAYCSLSGVLIKATTPLDKTIFHMVDVANPSTAVALLEYQARQSLEVFANLSATFRCQIL